MPSKTSTSHKKEWFSKAMFLQSYSSFAPIPIVYFIIVFMILPMNIFMGDFSAMSNNDIYYSLMIFPEAASTVGLPASFLTGCMSAMLSFRYLHNNRSANMVHSMPIRREALFVTQYIAGLSFVIIPNILILLITMLAFMYHGVFFFTPLFLFFGMHCASYFFFYSFAVLCSNMTGSIGGVPMFFLAFNFMALFVATLLSPLFEIFYIGFYGYVTDSPWVQKLTPVISFAYDCRIGGSISEKNIAHLTTEEKIAYQLTGDDIYFYLYDSNVFLAHMVVGVLFVVGAMWLYKIRHIESAGEAVAIHWLKPVFRFLISVLGGLSLGLLSVAVVSSSAGFTDDEMATLIPLASLLWAMVFAMVAEMILQKSFRVLGQWKKTLLPVATVGLIYVGLVVDITGYETYAPNYKDIVDINMGAHAVYPRDSVTLSRLPTEEGKVAQVYYDYTQQFHMAMLESNRQLKEDDVQNWYWDSNIHYTTLRYYHRDGESTQRGYTYYVNPEEVDTQGSTANILNAMANDPSLAEYSYDFPLLYDAKTLNVGLDCLYSPETGNLAGEMIQSLLPDVSTRQLKQIQLEILEALEQDLAEGNIGQRYISIKDEEFIQEGMYTWILVEYIFDEKESSSYYTDSDEVYNDKGSPTRITRNNGGTKGFALTTKAVHTLAVLEEYDILGDFELLTNLERLELEQKWFLEEDDNCNSVHFLDVYQNFDPENVYDFAPILDYRGSYD